MNQRLHTRGRRARRLRVDPWIAAAMVVLIVLVVWSAAGLATGAVVAPAVATQRVQVDVPVAVSVAPGWDPGDTAVRMPDLQMPGETQDATSSGWRLSSNWSNGYDVRVRSTTAPAMRGQNAVDGFNADAAFADYTQTGCPCPWTTGGFDSGVFGYSVTASATRGGAPIGVAKWGTDGNRAYRGFSRTAYTAFTTPAGTGEYAMDIHLRSEIPGGAVQAEGSYRATMVVSVNPVM